jgi:3-hydroxy-9,10-secoandrosta-1,3,5(10)-triene-9,17-dione monooxygenase reductase component
MSHRIDPLQFRNALGSFTTGVTIVTTVNAAGRDVGITANSFNSVSLDPPMVLWSIDRSSSSLGGFIEAPHFAVHVLANDQDALARQFARRGVDRFAGLQLERGPGGIPLLEGCAARFLCRMAFQYEGGDHVILVGEVQEFDHYEREPLVFKRGRFALAVHKANEAEPTAPEANAAPAALSPDFLIYQLGRAYHQIFVRLQPELQRRGLGVTEYFALSMLGARDDRRLSELDDVVSFTGTRIDGDCVRKLRALGLVNARDEPDAKLKLTAAGQRSVIELLAAAKAASEDAENGFDQSEARLLRQFLNRIIRSTGSSGDSARATGPG